jgi:hypothetical protein
MPYGAPATAPPATGAVTAADIALATAPGAPLSSCVFQNETLQSSHFSSTLHPPLRTLTTIPISLPTLTFIQSSSQHSLWRAARSSWLPHLSQPSHIPLPRVQHVPHHSPQRDTHPSPCLLRRPSMSRPLLWTTLHHRPLPSLTPRVMPTPSAHPQPPVTATLAGKSPQLFFPP